MREKHVLNPVAMEIMVTVKACSSMFHCVVQKTKCVSSQIRRPTNAKDDLIDVDCGEVYEEEEEVYNEE